MILMRMETCYLPATILILYLQCLIPSSNTLSRWHCRPVSQVRKLRLRNTGDLATRMDSQNKGMQVQGQGWRSGTGVEDNLLSEPAGEPWIPGLPSPRHSQNSKETGGPGGEEPASAQAAPAQAPGQATWTTLPQFLGNVCKV